MQQFGKRLLALLLVLCAVVGFLPATAFSAAAATETEIVGQQLSLGDSLTMNFHVSVSDTHKSDAVMNITVDSITKSYKISEETANEQGNYVFSVALGAPEMTTGIKLVLTSGGSTVIEKTYSIRDYAQYLLDGNYTAETKNLVYKLLNYGAKAQTYFGHNTGSMANKDNEIEETTVIPAEDRKVQISGSVGNITYYGNTLVFRSKIAMRYYFMAPNGVDGYTFMVNDETREPNKASGQLYYIEVADLGPAAMDQRVSVIVTKDSETLTVKYCPNDYIVRMYNRTTTTEKMKDLLVAMYGYFESAKTFAGIAREGSLTLAYRGGKSEYIQVNTNLPSDTPCVSFTAGDNGCSITQTSPNAATHDIGWIGMDNADDTIVLTLHFNKSYQKGQHFTLHKGSVFGFTDNSTYTLDKNYTFTFDGSAWTVKAHEDYMTMEYRHGTSNLIQVNTNLPATTALNNFLPTDNGCNIVQDGDNSFNWAGMDNADGTIVLTFHFDTAFTADQTYTLKAGSLFCFTDGSKYELEGDYTFYFNGSGWAMEAPPVLPNLPVLDLDATGGAANKISFATNLPDTTPCKDFLTADNGCVLDQTGNFYKNVGWVGMKNADGTITLEFNFGGDFQPGQWYTLGWGSIFGFTDGTQYVLDRDYYFYYDGTTWTETPVISFYNISGNSNTINMDTYLPVVPVANFLADANGCDLKQSGARQGGWFGMSKATVTENAIQRDKISLSVNFNKNFSAGEVYCLAKGSVFGFSDGSKFILDRNYTFYFDGNAWNTEPTVTLTYHYGTNQLIQYKTDLPVTTAIKDFRSTDNGCAIIQSGDQNVGDVKMHDPSTTGNVMILTFHFGTAFEFGQSYTLSKDSVFVFSDGSTYKLAQDITLYWNGAAWVPQEPVDMLEESNFTGGKDIITFADMPVDGNDPEKLKEYVDLGFNTSLLTEDHTGALGPDKLYKVESTDMTHMVGDLTFQYRWGDSKTLQVNTNLPASTPLANFTADQNGCSIDQSGNTVQWVGWIGMANADGTIVLTFNFNNAFKAGQTYVLPAGAVFGFTDGIKYTLDRDYTFTFDGSNWSMSCVRPLTLSQNAADAKYIQLKTNIPTGLTYGDFLLGDSSKGHNVFLETTEGAQAVAWFSYSELDGAVYLTFNFNGYNKPGTQYILKAGTTLKAGDNYYTLQQDYVMKYRNAYLESLEKLDKAGLNVWIRNYYNTAGYFSTELTPTLLLYKDLIDGFYMADEAFQTAALQEASGQTATTNFKDMVTLRDWFNTNFATKYFHSNQVPITSYDHYNSTTGSSLREWDVASYKNFLASYESGILDGLTTPSGASIGFDNYPFIHAQGGHGGFWVFGSTWESGIQKTFLASALTAAQVAKETGRDFSMCVQTFEAIDQNYKTSRDIKRASEVALQLYTGMAMGVDIFEYFAYNSNAAFNGIMDLEGNKRIYDIVMEGNQALCFQDVVNTFTWDGIMTSVGTNNNKVGFGYVSGMVLSDSNNGVLSSVTSVHDAIIGCFTKDTLNGYMVVNFEDPAAVTDSNKVNLTFANCTRARVYTQTGGVLSSQVVNLTDGVYTATLAPGSACFVIPA